jgi:hypothetical protein
MNYMDNYLGWLESTTPERRLEAGRETAWKPALADAGFCEDDWHDCKGFCGNCGIHLDEHGGKCGEYAARTSEKATKEGQ